MPAGGGTVKSRARALSHVKRGPGVKFHPRIAARARQSFRGVTRSAPVTIHHNGSASQRRAAHSSPSRSQVANRAARRTSAVADTVLRELNQPSTVFNTKIAPTGIAKRAAVEAGKYHPSSEQKVRRSRLKEQAGSSLPKPRLSSRPPAYGKGKNQPHPFKAGKGLSKAINTVGRALVHGDPTKRYGTLTLPQAVARGGRVWEQGQNAGHPLLSVAGSTPAVIPGPQGVQVLGPSKKTVRGVSHVLVGAANDTVNLPAGIPQTAYAVGRAGVEAAQGNTKPAEQIGEGLANHTFLGNLLQGNFTKAGKQLQDHPIDSLLELQGAKAVVGRGTGAGIRGAGKVTGSKTFKRAGAAGSKSPRNPHGRAPLNLLPGVKGGPTHPRTYSYDSINKIIQVLSDRRGNRKHGKNNVKPGSVRQKHLLSQKVNADLAMREGVRRARVSRGTAQVVHQTAGGRVARVRAKVPHSAAKRDHAPGLSQSHQQAIPLAVERVLTTPKNVVRDLQRYRQSLLDNPPAKPSHADTLLHRNSVKQLDTLLADKQFLANPHPAFHAADKVIAGEHPLQQRLQQLHLLSPDEASAAHIPYAIVHMKARPAEGRVPTAGYTAHLKARKAEAAAARGVRRAERQLITARQHEARSRGASEVRVTQADARLLRGDEQYKAAAVAHSRATRELQGALKAFGNAARNPKLYSEQDLAQNLARLRTAQRTHTATRADLNAAKAAANERLKPTINARPVGSLRRLERQAGNVQAAERTLANARLTHANARAERIATRVPRDQRSEIPFLLDSQGKPLTVEHVKAHMQANGVPEPGFFSQRPGATGSGSFYSKLAGRNLKRPALYSHKRSGLSTLQGTHEADIPALVAQRARSENIVAQAEGHDSLLSKYAANKDAQGNRQFFRTHSDAGTAAKELSQTVGVDLVPVNVGHTKAIQDLLDTGKLEQQTHADLSARVQEMFNDTAPGQYTLVPAVLRDKLLASVRPRGKGRVVAEELTKHWKASILTTSTHWPAGNAVDVGTRMAAEGIGPTRVLRGVLLHRKVRQVNPAAADEMAARDLAAFIRSQRGMETFRPPNRVTRLPVVKQGAWLWKTYRDAAYAIGSIPDRLGTYGALGKWAGRQMDGFMKLGGKGMEDLAQGMVHTHNQEAAAQFVERVVGRWGKYSPGMRAVLIHAPFVQWLGVALRYVYVTLPLHHPIKTGIAAGLDEMTADERKKLGLYVNLFHNDPGQLAPNQQAGVRPDAESKILPFGNLSSFGTAAQFATNPIGTLGNFAAAPQLSAALNLGRYGLDAFGNPVKNPDGSKPSQVRLSLQAAYSIVEPLFPFASSARRVMEQGGSGTPLSTIFSPKTSKKNAGTSIGAGLGKVLNPLHPQRPFFPNAQRTGSGGNPFLKTPGSSGGNPFLKSVPEGEGAPSNRQLLNAVAKAGTSVANDLTNAFPGGSAYKRQGVTYKQRLFAHPGRAGTGQSGKAQLASKGGQVTVKQILAQDSKFGKKVHAKIATQMRREGYSERQIVRKITGGAKTSYKSLGKPERLTWAQNVLKGVKGVGAVVPQNKSRYTPGDVSRMAQSHGAPKWLADALGRTMTHESYPSGNPRSKSNSKGGGSRGLLQINPAVWTELDVNKLYNPDYNVRSALYVISKQGSVAWSGSGTWHDRPVAPGQFNFPHPDKQKSAPKLTPRQKKAQQIVQRAHQATGRVPRGLQQFLTTNSPSGVPTSTTPGPTSSSTSTSSGGGGTAAKGGGSASGAGSPSSTFDPLALFQFFGSSTAPSGKSGDDLMGLLDALAGKSPTSFPGGKARNVAPKPLPVKVPKPPTALKSLARSSR